MDAQIDEMPEILAKSLELWRFHRMENAKSYVNALRISATKYRDEKDYTECKNILKYIKFLTNFDTQVHCADTDTTICDYIAESLLNYNREFVDAKQ